MQSLSSLFCGFFAKYFIYEIYGKNFCYYFLHHTYNFLEKYVIWILSFALFIYYIIHELAQKYHKVQLLAIKHLYI